MKFILLLTAAAAILGGCSGTYKSSQTPDDLYYSPARGAEEGAAGYYDEYTSSSEDRYLRMKVRNHYKWSDIDDYTYWNDSRMMYDQSFYYNYNYTNNYAYYNPWMWNDSYYYNRLSNAWGWGWGAQLGYGYFGGYSPWYNPWYTVISYKNPKVFRGSTSGSGLTAYGNRGINNSNRNNNGNDRYYTPNSQTKYNNNNSSARYNDAPVLTFSPSSTPSNSAGGRSGGYNSSGSGSAGGRAPRGN